MAHQILVVGSVNADCFLRVAHLPARGETVVASGDTTAQFLPGGKGANQAAAAARLAQAIPNMSCAMVCQFGTDTHAEMLKQALQASGVDTSLAMRADGPSGQAFVFSYPDGDNSIIVVPGANGAWPTPVMLPENVTQAIEHASIVLLQCEVPERVNQAVVECAAKAQVPVMWDCGGDERGIPVRILRELTFVCPNETELARLAHTRVNSVEEAIAAVRKWQKEEGAPNVLVTLGKDGAVLIPKDAEQAPIRQQAVKVEHVVDTTGAGDCFRGAFAVAFARGDDFAKCMKVAAAASALCVQQAGGLASMPTAAATQELLDRL